MGDVLLGISMPPKLRERLEAYIARHPAAGLTLTEAARRLVTVALTEDEKKAAESSEVAR